MRKYIIFEYNNKVRILLLEKTELKKIIFKGEEEMDGDFNAARLRNLCEKESITKEALIYCWISDKRETAPEELEGCTNQEVWSVSHLKEYIPAIMRDITGSDINDRLKIKICANDTCKELFINSSYSKAKETTLYVYCTNYDDGKSETKDSEVEESDDSQLSIVQYYREEYNNLGKNKE